MHFGSIADYMVGGKDQQGAASTANAAVQLLSPTILDWTLREVGEYVANCMAEATPIDGLISRDGAVSGVIVIYA